MALWTDADRGIVRDGYAQGVPVTDIARRLGVGKTLVTGIAKRMGLEHPRRRCKGERDDDAPDQAEGAPLSPAKRVAIPDHGRGCLWVTLTAGRVHYCGAATHGHSWCAEHRALALRPAREGVEA